MESLSGFLPLRLVGRSRSLGCTVVQWKWFERPDLYLSRFIPSDLVASPVRQRPSRSSGKIKSPAAPWKTSPTAIQARRKGRSMGVAHGLPTDAGDAEKTLEFGVKKREDRRRTTRGLLPSAE